MSCVNGVARKGARRACRIDVPRAPRTTAGAADSPRHAGLSRVVLAVAGGVVRACVARPAGSAALVGWSAAATLRANLRDTRALLGGCFLGSFLLDLGFAFLIEFHELVVAAWNLRNRSLTGEHRVGDALSVQLDRAHRVVVPRNRIV